MNKNTIMEIQFPYTKELLDSAKIPYINQTTSYAIPMMIICGLTSIPKTIHEPTFVNILSVIIMLAGAIILLLTYQKQQTALFNELYVPTENTQAHVTMDDRFYQYEVKNDLNTLCSKHNFCNELTDLIITKKTIGLLFNQDSYTIIPTNAIPNANIIKDLKKTVKTQTFGSKELFRFFSLILACLILINIIGWFPSAPI